MRTLILLFMLFWMPGALAEPVSEHEMKAVYLYNFAAQTVWPEMQRANFNFCTVGDEEVGLALTRFDARRMHQQRIVIARLSSLVAIRQCQLLYVPARQAHHWPAIVEKLGDLPVLTVSDAPAIKAAIGLSLEDKRLVFDLRLERFRQAGLQPGPTLKKLARAVSEDR